MRRLSRFLRFAWPLLFLLALQTFIVIAFPVKSGWSPAMRVSLFALVDILVGLAQWFSFARDRDLRRELKQLRESAERPR